MCLKYEMNKNIILIEIKNQKYMYFLTFKVSFKPIFGPLAFKTHLNEMFASLSVSFQT